MLTPKSGFFNFVPLYGYANDEVGLLQQVRLKNQHLKEIIDQIRTIIWEINTMITMRRTWLSVLLCVFGCGCVGVGGWVGLFHYSPISGFRFLSECNKNSAEVHFECEFSPSRIQTLTLSHPCVYVCVCVLSLIHIWRCRRADTCRSRWSPYH